ncbi:beta strand repeat-containing protein [Gluconacetobacter liquefaciens]|uniref:beta strand repeat-containing protein n=1 Tax=Gluconacetobacter liquefaciens TaxID=89584 RepID=UPI001B85E723|nr:GLUG motif-containing protein [Gluconacetobacter liquefaciens]
MADSKAKGNVTNTGRIQAAAATLASAGGNVYALAGNRQGLIQATGTKTVDGQVWLTAPNGSVAVDGTTVAATRADGAGGTIRANGGTVTVGGTAVLSASARRAGAAGGRILVGTDAMGGVNLARKTTIADGATLAAAGKGGGRGGAIETSAHVLALGKASVTAGAGGSWLLDPDDLTIDSAAAGTIDSALDAGTNVTEQTSASVVSGAGVSSSGNGDIVVNAPLSWSGTGTLTLTAYHSITLNAGMTISGAGRLTLTANNNVGGTSTGDGAVNFGGSAIQFTSAGLTAANTATNSPLTINGNGYTLITTPTELQNAVGTTGYYALARPLDMGSFGNFTPLAKNGFTGTFDGLGNTIANLTINDTTNDFVGLFARIGEGTGKGVVENVGLINSRVTGSADYAEIGPLAGVSYGTIANVYTTGSVSGGNETLAVGGLVGANFGTINNAYSTAAVSGSGLYGYIGGLVGGNSGTITSAFATGAVSSGSEGITIGGLVGGNDGTISTVHATGDVSSQGASAKVGGLVGWNVSDDSMISNAYASGTVSGTGGMIGGLVGASGGPLTNVYATGAVFGGNGAKVGGLVGVNYGTVGNSYATGAVSGGDGATVGGLVGQNLASTDEGAVVVGKIGNAYATGSVTGGNGATAGGLVGQNDGAIGNAYFDVSTSAVAGGVGSGSSAGVQGLTTAQLAGGLPGGFDAGVWGNLNNQTTPYLLTVAANQQVLSGSDTVFGAAAGVPVTAILSAAGLRAVDGNLAGNYGLGADIDASSLGNFAPLAENAAFTGIFYGADHTIANLTINDTTNDYVGLFVRIGDRAGKGVVENVGLINSRVTGSAAEAEIGPLAGVNLGTIANVYTTGSVSGGNETLAVGGLVGANFGTINNAYSTAAVSGSGLYGYIGGLVGGNSGTITSAFATGAVSSGSEGIIIGGLVGGNEGTISTVHATGDVSSQGESAAVGGLVGWNLSGDSTISNAYASGTVSGTDGEIGGLVGSSGGRLMNVYATGAVFGGNGTSVGGLVGMNYGTVGNSYATGAVLGGDGAWLGGLVGINGGTVGNSYATGAVSGGDGATVGGLVGQNLTTTTGEGTAFVGKIGSAYATGSVTGGKGAAAGGLVGENDSEIGNAYFDASTSAVADGVGSGSSAGVQGLTTAQLAGGLPGGFDAGVWGNLNNQTTPYLLTVAANQQVLSGSDTVYGVVAGAPVTAILSAAGLRAIDGDPAGNYGLGADIDASSLGNFAPLAENAAFTGIFYGAGHTIANLTINDTTNDYVGLFGQVGDGTGNGVVENVGLIGSSVTGSASDAEIGALAGINRGTVADAYAAGSVSGHDDAIATGGLVGANFGTISNAYSTAVVSGDYGYIGGLVGGNSGTIVNAFATGVVSGGGDVFAVGGLAGGNEGTISDVYATGAIFSRAAYGSVGGLVGWNMSGWGVSSDGTISNAYATGTVSGSDDDVIGGLVGDNESLLMNSYATGAVFGGNRAEVGGLVGVNYGTVGNSYATGAVSGGDGATVGGLVGQNLASADEGAVAVGKIGNAYATGSVTGGNGATAGGLVGQNDSAIGNAYFDESTSAVADGVGSGPSAGVQGLTTAQLAGGLPGGFDAGVWGNLNNQTTPYLLTVVANQQVLSGSDTVFGAAAGVPVTAILSAAGLRAVDGNLAGNYGLGADIDASSLGNFAPLAESSAFTGIFYGAGHTIANLTINDTTSGYVGLFGQVGDGSGNGVVENVRLADANVTGHADDLEIGALAGVNQGTIANVYVTGSVWGGDGTLAVGGLAGKNFGAIVNASSAALVSNSGEYGYLGGLVGGNYGTISGAVATGAVSSKNDGMAVGGLVGANLGTIVNASSAAAVSDSGAYGYLGGLVGGNSGTISNAFATGAVSSEGNGTTIGGLVGGNDGLISDVYATGAVSMRGDSGFVGGLVGWNLSGWGEDADGVIRNAYATGTVSGSDDLIGGLVGDNESLLTNSYATGAVSGGNGSRVGGLVGGNVGTVSNSYAVGVVSGGDGARVGGLVGENAGTTDEAGVVFGKIANAYATGALTGGSGAAIGGLVGKNEGTISSAYFNSSTAGTTTGVGDGAADGTYGLTTGQWIDGAASNGFADAAVWVAGAPYPVLKALPYITVSADGTQTYGQNAPPAVGNVTYTASNGVDASGLVDGSHLTWLDTSLTATSNAGSTVAMGGQGVTAAGYQVVYVATDRVTPAALTVTAGSQSSIYGQTPTLDGSAYSTVGLVNGDTVSGVALATAATSRSPAGTYAIAISDAQGSGLSNYVMTYQAGVYTVQPNPAVGITPIFWPLVMSGGNGQAQARMATGMVVRTPAANTADGGSVHDTLLLTRPRVSVSADPTLGNGGAQGYRIVLPSSSVSNQLDKKTL